MLRVIVNADDFGKSHEVNVAVEEQIKKGNITSATIMANADGFVEAIRMAKRYPQISYGVHLSLDEYAPVTIKDVFIKKGVVDANSGLFVKGKIWQVQIDDELKDAVRDEWTSQIKKIKEAGISPSHVDSHHHVHSIPALEETLLDVMRKHGLSKARSCYYVSVKKILYGWKHFTSSNILKEMAYLILRHPRFKNKRKWVKNMRRFVKMTDEFCSVAVFLRNRAYFDKCSNDFVVEVECHPGHPAYKDETRMLDEIDKRTLISYKDL